MGDDAQKSVEGSEDYTAFGTLRVARPAAMPDVLDVLVAGGGPAGAAAAVRARELGLSCLVIDYDDLMKRIRDYPEGKPIKPSYGGGDKLPFPPGGAMVTALHFDEIDKDDLVKVWKAKFKEFDLTAKVGSEFTGLQPAEDGVWVVKTWNHRANKEVEYRARAVLLAIGAGVPRRFDIPGNTDGIAFRLDSPARFVGAPALVIGGGTSAGEAVIAISNAKIRAEDPTPVYWSYRGDKLPKVSKALSEEFFDAYIGNGNIRYVAFSEPAAVVTGPDKLGYLSLLVDRKVIAGRPVETVHLEFPKERVVACIGEEVPFKLLQSFGIKVPLVNNRPQILVNHEGESSLRGVFLVGDLRGPKYLRCTDFNDSSSYEVVSQKRNIKAAMWDAVQAVEVAAERLGKAGARMAADAMPKLEAKATPQTAPIAAPQPSMPEPSQPAQTEAQLVILLPDGTPEEQFPITKDAFTIGRREADVTAAEDVYMADKHASVTLRGGQYLLEDTSGGSGVWLRVQGVNGRPLGEGDVVWIGGQILMATRADGHWAVAHYDSEGAFKASHAIGEKGLFVGRGSEAKLDPNDMSMSRRHAQFRVDAEGLKVYDLASTNGTYVKITQPAALANGDEFRAGAKRFRFERFQAVAKLPATDIVVDAPVERAPAPAAESTPAAAGQAAAPAAAPVAAAAPAAAVGDGQFPVTIEHAEFPVSYAAGPGQDLLHAYFDYLKSRYPDGKLTKTGEPADHHDEPLGWECKVGLCGLCAVEIVDQAENFEPVDPGKPEMNTLEFKAGVDPDPKKYRLACLAKVKGPVKLTIPS